MAINPANENLPSLTEATKVLPRVNGRKPAVSTLWWRCRKGLRGVYLEYLRIGRIWFYRPSDHKTAHHSHERRIYIGPLARIKLVPGGIWRKNPVLSPLGASKVGFA